MNQIFQSCERLVTYERMRDATNEIKKVKKKGKGRKKGRRRRDFGRYERTSFRSTEVQRERYLLSAHWRSVAKRMYTFFSLPKGGRNLSHRSIFRVASSCYVYPFSRVSSLEEIKVNVRGNVLLSCRIQSESIVRGRSVTCIPRFENIFLLVEEKILLRRDYSFCTLIIAIRADRFALKRNEISTKPFKSTVVRFNRR